MLKRMRILLILLLSLSHLAVYAQVYKTVDEDGNVIFSDTPTDDSVEVEVKDPLTIPPATNKKFEYTPQQKTEGVYQKVEIVSPKNDEAIRSNNGNVSVSIAVQPQLSAGHKVVLYLDGKEYGTGRTSFSLSNLDRGTHSLRAVVRDSADRLLVSSKTVNFHLLRHSVQFRRPAQQQAAR